VLDMLTWQALQRKGERQHWHDDDAAANPEQTGKKAGSNSKTDICEKTYHLHFSRQQICGIIAPVAQAVQAER